MDKNTTRIRIQHKQVTELVEFRICEKLTESIRFEFELATSLTYSFCVASVE